MTDKATVLKQAQKFLAKGQVDKAIQVWEEFVQNNPDGNIFNTVGDLYLKSNDKKQAAASFHKAARFIRDEGFSLKALAIYKKILNIDSSDPEALLALGELNEEKGLVPEAIKFYLASVDARSKRGQKQDILQIYNKILNLAPSNIPLRSKIAEYFIKEGFSLDASKELLYIARLCEEKGDSRSAVEYFNKALQLHPENKDAYLSMAKLYETLGKKNEATVILKKALHVFQDDTELMLQVANQFIGGGEINEAVELLKRAGERDPDNIRVREQIAQLHLMRGNKEKAWSVYSSIIDELLLVKKPEQLISVLRELSDVDPVEIGKRLASLYKESGDTDSAFDEMLHVGTILKDSGMHEEAINIINEARQIKPDSDDVAHMIDALKEEMGVEQEPGAEPKSPEEALAEVEAFLGYGQIDEAMKILEDLKSADPENPEVHRKLKSLYLEFGEKELAVTECLILANLYEKEGDTERKDHILSEAFDIDPNDPRLSDRRTAAVVEESILTPTGLDLAQPDTYTEEMSEADFYFRQGLVKEALKIYRKYAELMPDNEEIRQKIEMITAEHEPVEALQDGTGTSLQEQSGMSLEAPGEEPSKEGAADTLEGFQEISFAAKNEPVQAEEIPEPTLENDVLEIFEEFKKGIESELEEEDSDTHYNLGIAYKEMGLIDDAIKEFQTANRDPRKHIQASSMLGLCYKEKGLYPLAIEAFKNALAHIAEKDGSYWGAKFDLAEVYQKGGNLREAVALYTEIYAYDSKFRNVDEKLNSLKGAIKEVPAQESSGPDAKKKKNRISYI